MLITIILGVLVNVLLSYITYRWNLPIFLDTVGTIAVSALGGFFPGVLVAVITNIVCTIFNKHALYFAFINAIMALMTSRFVKHFEFQKVKNTVLFVLSLAFVSGSLSSFVQWGLFHEAQNPVIGESAESFAAATNLPVFPAFFIVNILLNILDKGLADAVAVIAIIVTPKHVIDLINENSYRQKSLTNEQLKAMKEWGRGTRKTIRKRITITLMGALLALVVLIAAIGSKLYFDFAKEEKANTARNAAKFAAEIIDGDRVADYIKKGRMAEGYIETEKLLYSIKENAQGVQYLYALKVSQDGCTFIFDLDVEGEGEYYKPGDFVPIEEAFLPILPKLLAGEEIEPIESNSQAWNWVETVYYPVRDSLGMCVAYVGADVSLDYLAEKLSMFVLKVALILAGFFILILAFGLWDTDVYITYPINSIAICVENFIKVGADLKKLDKNVKRIRALDIRTDDEVEKLYHAICSMSLNQTEQLRSLRHFSDATAKMQDGLIITMADMVENRDSDTGAHIQKTAAFVRIIVEGLKRKGYYAEKIDAKYMSDVIRSAPLHDVGKINISDRILNKPGKLTDEEFEIMKTHTTIGKNLLENAISTVSGENYLKEARNMAGYHHERWDGKGYPEGLHGEVIPLSARIMAVADVFDALTSPRVYKPPFTLEKALEIIKEGSGTQFDPKVVEVFIDSLSEVKTVLRKYHEEA
ncbi:MAG: HD-GYP domain-containing protein [Lachnospiraceae bacterium]|nr:HD-GYP domain-containing protein [Lachnospiraceae bacterium]